MMRLFPLASSSKGNSAYIGDETSGILIDVGIGPRTFRNALALGGIEDLSAIRAVFITHEHSDHIKGLYQLTQRLDVPVYGSRETLVNLIESDAVTPTTKLYEINRKSVEIAGMQIRAFHTSHDTPYSQGYRIELPCGDSLGFCTDLGVITDEVHNALLGCKTVLLESNYDRHMLINGIYPLYLKRRIDSECGHLCNDDCAVELVKLASLGTERFAIGHLSEENNRPELAAEASLAALAAAGFEVEKDFTLFTSPRTTTGRYVSL